jgi:hypothetical protein
MIAPRADFTAHRHPVLAVACPDCRARVGVWCVRPSAHKAADLHAARRAAADERFIAQHGGSAWIERLDDDAGWRIHPHGYAGTPSPRASPPAAVAQLSLGL